VMEFVDGKNIKEVLAERGRIPPMEALAIVRAVTLGLLEAEKHKIVHRDIKPENIMIDTEGVVKLCDLGLAKDVDQGKDQVSITQTAETLCTPAYVSPEQAMNVKDLDVRADIYSLGLTFFEMVTGEKAFSGSSSTIVMMKHLDTERPDPGDRVKGLPEGLRALIRRMISRNREDRPEDAEALLETLDACGAAVGTGSSDAVKELLNEPEEKSTSDKRRTGRVAVAIVLGFVLIGLLAVGLKRWLAGPDWFLPEPLAGHLMLHYDFDEVRKHGFLPDRSGHGHLAFGSRRNLTQKGVVKRAYQFSRYADEIRSVNYSGITGGLPRSVSFWFRDEATPKHQSSSVVLWGKLEEDGSRWDVCIFEGVVRVDTHWGDAHPTSPTVRILDGRWHHVVATFTEGGGKEDIRIYLDGVPQTMGVGEKEQVGERMNTSDGGPVTVGGRSLLGMVDELMIFDKALSSEEVTALFGSYEEFIRERP
ncbi:MAG: protein kinase, partial [Verrucomicrobiota bacterium]